jgi:hypothetical protein
MKTTITIFTALILTVSAFAQAPNKMSYQAVIRDNSNALVTNSSVGMQISILQTSPSGTAIYAETQTPTTNANGLVSIEIGSGTVVSGSFSTIDWASGPYFIKTETDPIGGTNYSILGISQLLSVPYALYAKKAEIDNIQDGDTTHWKVNGSKIYYNQGNVGIGLNSNNSNSLLFLRGYNYNQNTLWSQGYVTDNPGDPAIVNIRGIGDGPAVLEISKESGTARNFGWIRMGVDGNLTNLFGSNGGFGIGIQPQRALHINDVMRLEPRNTAPSSPAKGDIYFDNTINKLRVYDGTTWQNCW